MCTLLSLLGYHATSPGAESFASDPLIALANCIAAWLAIWSAAFMGIQLTDLVVRHGALLQEKEAASREIKILKGFLPICSYCNRIHEGDNRWLSLERYVRERSDLELSHGICPDCIKELHPEIDAWRAGVGASASGARRR